jgi:hypothetical protein
MNGLNKNPDDWKDVDQEIPKRCPLLGTCKREVIKTTYIYTCNTEHWINCGLADKLSKKYRKSPSDWHVEEAAYIIGKKEE